MTIKEAIDILNSEYMPVRLSEKHSFAKLHNDAIDNAISALKEPPRKHGRWNLVMSYDDGIKVYRCSICDIPRPTMFTYCPSCGAFMDIKDGEKE